MIKEQTAQQEEIVGEKVNEKKMHELLQISLQTEYDIKKINTKVYTEKDYRNIIGKKHALKPDLVIFHEIKFIDPVYKKQRIFSPIGLEYKHAGEFHNITKGVLNQITKKYADETFLLKPTNEIFKLNSLAFATTSSCSSGFVYEKEFKEASNFFVERMCWASNVIVLLKIENQYWFSFGNRQYTIDGLKCVLIGKHGERIKMKGNKIGGTEN